MNQAPLMNDPRTVGSTIWVRLSVRRVVIAVVCLLGSIAGHDGYAASEGRMLRLNEIGDKQVSFQSEVGESRTFTWWLPEGAEAYVLPICAGVLVDASRSELVRWLQDGSPWSLLELPALGVQYGDQIIVVIVPWPHYAELIIQDRIGIRYAFPKGRPPPTPCEIVAMRRNTDPLEVARGFREWRQAATDIGALPRPRSFQRKIAELKKAGRLLGAPHFYLWGPALFSRHDVPRHKWVAFAKALQSAPSSSFGGTLVSCFRTDPSALPDLAAAEWPMDYLTVRVSGEIDRALSRPDLLDLSPEMPLVEVIRRNRQALADAFAAYLNPPDSWGDGLSTSLLDSLHDAGVERALLLLSDLFGESPRPDVLARAEEYGYLVGPYDSYHSVHSPTADPSATWETAQFDAVAYERGRVINADGSGHAGFKRRGYHFAPRAAWPYVQQRVGRIAQQAPYSAWFIDCDATGECFDDFSAEHPATKVEDLRLRRQRLAWLESEHQMVVGSEGGSALFADVIHFGHGVQTPYIGHLDPEFRDRHSPHYLGRYWPPDSPEQSFKPVPIPPSMRTPYFDPAIRIPLYQAACGDEVIVTHHWSMDSLKFDDVEPIRELMEILYMVPPMYHMNRGAWTVRRERILRHLAFWGPLHRQCATSPLTQFECLSEDRLVQRTTFQPEDGEVTITVNFGAKAQMGYPPFSATVSGAISMSDPVYQAGPSR